MIKKIWPVHFNGGNFDCLEDAIIDPPHESFRSWEIFIDAFRWWRNTFGAIVTDRGANATLFRLPLLDNGFQGLFNHLNEDNALSWWVLVTNSSRSVRTEDELKNKKFKLLMMSTSSINRSIDCCCWKETAYFSFFLFKIDNDTSQLLLLLLLFSLDREYISIVFLVQSCTWATLYSTVCALFYCSWNKGKKKKKKLARHMSCCSERRKVLGRSSRRCRCRNDLPKSCLFWLLPRLSTVTFICYTWTVLSNQRLAEFQSLPPPWIICRARLESTSLLALLLLTTDASSPFSLSIGRSMQTIMLDDSIACSERTLIKSVHTARGQV